MNKSKSDSSGNTQALSQDTKTSLSSRHAAKNSPIERLSSGDNELQSDKRNENKNATTGRDQKKNEKETILLPSDEDEFLIPVFILQGITTGTWFLSVLYCTYHAYLAAEEVLEWQRDPIMNPGPFTHLLQRGRDTSDYEWSVFTEAFFGSVIYWYLLYLVATRLVHQYLPEHVRNLQTMSACFSFIFLVNLIGTWPTICLFIQPVIFWLLLRLNDRFVIWSATILYLFFLNSSWCRFLIPTVPGLGEYYFFITAAWNVARCVSFCMDNLDRKENTSLHALVSYVKYCFYFPLVINGPLILYEKYEKDILLRPPVAKTKGETMEDLYVLMGKFMRMMFWTVFIELVLHYFYFRPLALTIPALYDINWWALCGVVYWLGQFFQMKYVVMYGIPSAMAEFEGLGMPPLPRCIGYIHRYSVLWKDFDRGLYYFLIRYTYLPTLGFITKVDSKNRINPEVRKLIASFASFTYVYIWHSVSFEVFVWAAFNFLGITLERIGSCIKRLMDAKWNITPLFWDVLVEPVVTIPLCTMSVINSSVFTGTLSTANVVFYRFCTESHYVFHFVYFFTHAGVTVRTCPQWYPRVRARFAKTLVKFRGEAESSANNKPLKTD